MENKEVKQLTHLMQTILDGQEKILETLSKIQPLKGLEKSDNYIKIIEYIEVGFNTIIKNQMKIFNCVKLPRKPEKVVQNNDYTRQYTSQYFFFHPGMFERVKKWMVIIGIILIFSPSVYYYFLKKKYEKEYNDYKYFYEYIHKLEGRK